MYGEEETSQQVLQLVDALWRFSAIYLRTSKLEEALSRRNVHSLEYLLASYFFSLFCPYRVEIRFSAEINPASRVEEVERIIGRLAEVESAVNQANMSLDLSLSPEHLSPLFARVKEKIIWMNLSFWDSELGRMPLLAHVKLLADVDRFRRFWKDYWDYTSYRRQKNAYTLNEFVARCRRSPDYAVCFDETEGLIGPEVVIRLAQQDPSLNQVAETLREFEPCGEDGGQLFSHASAIVACRRFWLSSSRQPIKCIYFFPYSLEGLTHEECAGGQTRMATVAIATTSYLDASEYYFLKLSTLRVLDRLLLLNLSNSVSRKTDAAFRYALRSAIAAIMSRNMSHNIGSHVLARIVTGGIDGWTQGLGMRDIVDKLSMPCMETTLRNLIDSLTEIKQLFSQSQNNNNIGDLQEKLNNILNQLNDLFSKAQTQASPEQVRSLVVWGKDVQFLARYLQQRMDFIAQVSTEWPTWSEPTWFMQDLMRWFLSQKHLLNYIAYSDGMEAHLYQESSPTQDTCASTDLGQTQQSEAKPVAEKDNSSGVGKASQEQAKQIPNSSNDTCDEQRGDIRLHVFLVPEDCWNKSCGTGEDMVRARRDQVQRGCTKDATQLPCKRGRGQNEQPCEQCHRILLYTGKDTLECRLDEDFQVAIPGGVVGQHAFFTILENIIRNAAKHGYAQQKNQTGHLDVVIEVLYDPGENVAIQNEVGDQTRRIPAYLFRIYTNVSPVDGSNAVVSVDKMNEILGKGIIKETGEMERANWGHAEMKIAAGYLQWRDIMHIGGQGQEITGEPGKSMLELGTSATGSRAIIRAVRSPIGTLGYEFYIPRPRTVGIVCPEGGES